MNVPNASVMVIENAERFGLSQLHQLRGRVGRGAEQSFCVLMTDFKLRKETRTRLETMCRTNNGFEIAEVDLELRGPGDLTGTQQSGIMDLLIADLTKDGAILKEARRSAEAILNLDPELATPVNAAIRGHLDSPVSYTHLDVYKRQVTVPQQQAGFAVKGDVRSVLSLGEQVLIGINQQSIKAYRPTKR